MMIPKAYSVIDLAQRRRAPIGWFSAVVRLPVSSIEAHIGAPASLLFCPGSRVYVSSPQQQGGLPCFQS